MSLISLKSYALLRETQRIDETLLPFNNELIKNLSNEIKELVLTNQSEVANASDQSIGNVVFKPIVRARHSAIKRDVRALMVYHGKRLDYIKTMRWEFGSVLPPEIQSNLSASEINFFSKYSSILSDYMRSIGDEGLNLQINLRPPKALFIEVKCLMDYGKLELNDGSILLLKKNSRHFLPRDECEELIRQGFLQHIVA